MSRYRPALLRRSDSISNRWVQSQEEARDNGLSLGHRPSTISLPTAQVAQSPKQAAEQAATLRARFPDLGSEELNELIDQFHSISSAKFGWISQSAAINAVRDPDNSNYNRARETMKTIRADATDKLEIEDWIEFIVRLRSDSAPAMEPGKRDGTLKTRGADGSISHTIDDDERVEFTEYINSALGSDPDVSARLPIPTDTMQIFDECRDGIIICKLIEHFFPGTIDSVMGVRRRRGTSYLNIPSGRHHLNRFQIAENNNVAVLAAQAIGVNVVNISGQDLSEGREHLILSLIGQIIRQGKSEKPRPMPKQQPHSVRSSTPVEQKRSSTPVKLNRQPSFTTRPTRGRSMSMDTADDITRVPSPVSVHRTGTNHTTINHIDHDRVDQLRLRSKLVERGTFKLLEDLKGGIIILETLDKVSPTRQASSPHKQSWSTPIETSSRPTTPSFRKFESIPKVYSTKPVVPAKPIFAKSINHTGVTKGPSMGRESPNHFEIEEGTVAKHRAVLSSLHNRNVGRV